MRPKNFERTFDDKSYGDMVDFLNTLFLNGITIDENLSAQVVNVSFESGPQEIKVSHKLGTVPKYRIVLRQDTSEVLVDGDETWTDKSVTFKTTNGNANYTVMLIRS